MDRLAQTPIHAFSIVMIAAVLSGCGTAAQRQYQTAVSGLPSEECRALQAVVEEREQYGIIARSRDLEEEALRQCGLPHSSGGGPPFQQTRLSPPVQRPEEVQIERRGD